MPVVVVGRNTVGDIERLRIWRRDIGAHRIPGFERLVTDPLIHQRSAWRICLVERVVEPGIQIGPIPEPQGFAKSFSFGALLIRRPAICFEAAALEDHPVRPPNAGDGEYDPLSFKPFQKPVLVYLTDRWDEWSRRGRTEMAGEYARQLRRALRLAKDAFDLAYEQVEAEVGRAFDDGFARLAAILPDWTRQARDQLERSLQHVVLPRAPSAGPDLALVGSDVTDLLDWTSEHSWNERLRRYSRCSSSMERQFGAGRAAEYGPDGRPEPSVGPSGSTPMGRCALRCARPLLRTGASAPRGGGWISARDSNPESGSTAHARTIWRQAGRRSRLRNL